MSGGCKKTKAELVAIYRLEFYRKQKSWKFCSDVRRDFVDKAAIKNSLNETYSVEQESGERAEGEAADARDSHDELNKAFVEMETGPDKNSPPPESLPNTPQSWPEYDPNQTQAEWSSGPLPVEHIPTPPPYHPPKPLPDVWSQPLAWEADQYPLTHNWANIGLNAANLREKCPELNRSYTKIDWINTEKTYPDQTYPENRYSEETYPEGTYTENKYLKNKYPENRYPEETYPENINSECNYPENTYPETTYLEKSYSDAFKNWQDNWKPQEWAEYGPEPACAWEGEGREHELPELDPAGGEDTWPLTGWDIPGVGDAVWSEEVVEQLARLVAGQCGARDLLLRRMLTQWPAGGSMSQSQSRPPSRVSRVSETSAQFMRGAHCAPHSTEVDLCAQLDHSGTDDESEAVAVASWSEARLLARGRHLARALRTVAAELDARRRLRQGRGSGAGRGEQRSEGSSSTDTERPTRDVGLRPPGDLRGGLGGDLGGDVLAGSHRLHGGHGWLAGGSGQRVEHIGPSGGHGKVVSESEYLVRDIGLGPGDRHVGGVGLGGVGRGGPRTAACQGQSPLGGAEPHTGRGRGRLPRPVDQARPARARGRC